jgi:hypothetical protein
LPAKIGRDKSKLLSNDVRFDGGVTNQRHHFAAADIFILP